MERRSRPEGLLSRKRAQPAPTVAVDAMGGDYGPDVVVRGCVEACRGLDLKIQLVGERAALAEELNRSGGFDLGIEIVDAPDTVDMGEKVSRATLKRRSSILVALERVKDGEADAFFSAGNTAAVWTIAKLVLGSLPEIDRPALAAVVPNVSGYTVLLDVGANVNCKARNLEEFAVMGEVYARSVLGADGPRVGLMSLGAEDTKGTDAIREANAVLRRSGVNFVGNVEGGDIFLGAVDVVVTDGFTGNVALKSAEALADSIMQLLREELVRTPFTRIGGLLSRPAFRRVRRRIDPSEYGGAPLLGLAGCCVIGHGRSNPRAIKHGIRTAAEFFVSGVNEQIGAEVSSLARDEPAAQTGTE